jgi:hypothetical protein
METKPESNSLYDEVFAIGRMQDNDPAIYHDLTLSQAEAVERQFGKRALPGGSSRYLNSFEDWFFEHCMKREIRPVEALEDFLSSKSRSIRAITTKAMRDRYGVLQSDQLSAELVLLTGKTVELTGKTVEINHSVANSTKWIMWATCLSALLSAASLFVSCSSAKQTDDGKASSSTVSR